MLLDLSQLNNSIEQEEPRQKIILVTPTNKEVKNAFDGLLQHPQLFDERENRI